MRIAGLLLCCCAVLLAAGCSGQDAAATVTAPTSTSTAPPVAVVEPKIVVQLGHQAPVLAVRWVDGGRHLASIARDGSIVLWNVASGSILDHAQVPLDPALFHGHEAPLRFHAVTEARDAGTLAIAYTGTADGNAERDCPAAHHPGTRWCTYALDLATRVVRADPGLPLPADGANNVASHWPISPDGRLRPEPNHGSGRRGLPDTSDDHFGDLDPTCTSVQRCRYGVTLFAHDASATREPEPVAQLVGHRSPVLAAQWGSNGRPLISVTHPEWRAG